MTEEIPRRTMVAYYKKTDREEVTQGFLPANPVSINIKATVLGELIFNQFRGDNTQDPLEHLTNFKEICTMQKHGRNSRIDSLIDSSPKSNSEGGRQNF
ncbi:hypothetical protein A2U01_0026639 [Trifolium medium]|uniref:Uncharacterized protein n=1 Tax=Trifolium medium TaxID=97028 RepID=A0A392P2L0_9FABA|nr:hypothetical protein [Trifolium medium]